MGFYPAGPFEQLHHRSSRVGRIIISSIFRLASETGLIVSRDVAHDHQRQRYDRRPSNEPPTGLTRTLYVCTVCTYTRMNILLVDACISLTSGQLDPTHRLTPPPPGLNASSSPTGIIIIHQPLFSSSTASNIITSLPLSQLEIHLIINWHTRSWD